MKSRLVKTLALCAVAIAPSVALAAYEPLDLSGSYAWPDPNTNPAPGTVLHTGTYGGGAYTYELRSVNFRGTQTANTPSGNAAGDFVLGNTANDLDNHLTRVRIDFLGTVKPIGLLVGTPTQTLPVNDDDDSWELSTIGTTGGWVLSDPGTPNINVTSSDANSVFFNFLASGQDANQQDFSFETLGSISTLVLEYKTLLASGQASNSQLNIQINLPEGQSPLPSSLALFALGGTALGLSRRRRQLARRASA
jgi:hypothetical protein